MDRSDTIADLAKALALAQSHMDHASKDRTNPAFKAKYATLASVLDACRTPLSHAGLAVLQPARVVLDGGSGGLVEVDTMLVHASGEWVRETLTAAVSDVRAQTIGSAITYLRRYGLSALVGIAPDDDDDDGQTASSSTTPAAQRRPGPAPVPVPAAGPEKSEKRLAAEATLRTQVSVARDLAAQLGIADWSHGLDAHAATIDGPEGASNEALKGALAAVAGVIKQMKDEQAKRAASSSEEAA